MFIPEMSFPCNALRKVKADVKRNTTRITEKYARMVVGGTELSWNWLTDTTIPISPARTERNSRNLSSSSLFGMLPLQVGSI